MKPFLLRTAAPILLVALVLLSRSLERGARAASGKPSELVRRAVENEIKNNNQGTKYMFRQRKETPTGSQTRLMVETRDAMVGMVVANNDQPLNQEQRRAEYGRIERFVNQPDELERKRKQEKENAERVNLILKALPDAFLYEYDGTETGRPGVGKPGEHCAAQVPSQPQLRSADACGAGPGRHAGSSADRCAKTAHRQNRWHAF